ncbi:hypothetical protein [Leisingera sp. ANG-Vp]|uniref:hypothetical protein n=1 Tax=Leisingera sp. ANG-Vp TaxID=1577896 RepID=UPI0005809846|nr:hypothetical protein [Leisingera sp. ANG-Vp]KIC17588.1 hypothetical protein RA20_14605 [Leisingera sp. ANG-Vp]
MSVPNCGALALVLTLAGTGALAGTSYSCDLKPLSGASWIPARITVHFSEDFSTADVEDAAFGVSAPARVVKRSATSYGLSWSLPGLAVSPGESRAEPRFRAVLNTANRKMSIQSVLTAADAQLPRGSGSCRMQRTMSQLARIDAG